MPMPSLRRTARAPQLNRSSTTPYASPTGTPSESTGSKRQSLMTEWTEPAPQTLAPSFEEHGFARHGVLETMAPLGVPPSAKVKQRTRAMGEAAARNAAFGKGMAPFGEEVGSTPEMTPAPELEPDDSERQEEDEMQVDFPMQDEEEDDDYEPTTKTKKKGKVAKTPVRGKTPVQGKTPLQGRTPVRNGTSKAPSVSASPAVQAVQPVQPPLPAPACTESEQRVHTAVNDAIIRANHSEKRQIGIALREMWEDSRSDPTIADMMDAVIREAATDEQWGVFRTLIKKSRKRQRNAAKLKRLQEANAGRRNSDVNGSLNPSRRPSPRASSEVYPHDATSAFRDMADREVAVPSTSATAKAHLQLQASLGRNSADPRHPLNTAPAIPAADTSADSTPRQPSKSPRKKLHMNGYSAPGDKMDIDSGLPTTAQGLAGKTPDSGAGSDSELSEVNEEIVQKGPPEPVQANGKSKAAAAELAAKKIKSAAYARAAKKSKPNAGKLFGKHAHKAHQPTPEQLEEYDKAYELRKELVKQQPIRQLDLDNFPVSDVRFDDEINDTESLTESMIAVGPPVDSDQPRRAGRVPHHGAKRLREDGFRLSSPLAESATGTRPSTPAVGPAAKRPKLNHNSNARTKRSPVKNREGGPIAGVAYVNGGGGSRQLGPDDNDPNSPQSESDDLCSACKGAGEFVCCEGCPRVFHLLCCDPPRVDVPEDEFYCYECKAKSGEDSAPDYSRQRLGPLFEAIERTNPRAFSLPLEIQTLFEGVSARADGSYYEEVKKFPLAKNSGYGHQKPDYTRVLDGDHKPILCTQCGASSGGKRQMLKCDFCHAHWHLDCLDPPLANPPHIGMEASQRDAWRCPRHIEHDLRSGLLLQHDLNELDDDVEMAGAAPVARVARKVRKRKHTKVIEPTFSRGMRNNGLIEIINDPDDDTDGEGNYVFGLDDKDLNSKVFRIPERGVILDFVSKVKSGRVAKNYGAQHPAKAAAQRKASMQNLIARPMRTQQAAINLARMANKEQNMNLGEGKLDLLLLTLTAEADKDVTTAVDNAGPPSVNADERKELLVLQELIARRLKG